MALTVRIEGLRFRRSDGLVSLERGAEILRQRLQGQGGLGLRASDSPANTAQLLAMLTMRQTSEIRVTVVEVAAPGVEESAAVAEGRRAESVLDLDMVAVPGTRIKAMRSEVTMEMFRQFMQDQRVREDGYRPQGHNVGELIRLVNGTEDGAIVYLNKTDCERFRDWARKKTGDQSLRLPTEQEWQVMESSDVRGQLSGGNWERLADEDGEIQFFRCLHSEIRGSFYSSDRYNGHALRLVGGSNS